MLTGTSGSGGEIADPCQVYKAEGQAVPGSVDFHSLCLLLVTPPSPLHLPVPGQMRHVLRTHSHRAVIRPDSPLRSVFCFHCIHSLKKKQKKKQVSCSPLLKLISCCGRFYGRALRPVRLVFIRRGTEVPRGGRWNPLNGKAHSRKKKGKWDISKKAWSGRSAERRTKRGDRMKGLVAVQALSKHIRERVQRGSFNNHISIQADNVSLKTDNGSLFRM